MKIAIIGSAHSHGYSPKAKKLAVAIGYEIASHKHILLYGPEIEMPSLSYFAARAAKERNGTTMAVAIGRARTPFFDQSAASFIVYSEGSGGALREVVFINSADAVISIGGGSGTLTEISIAYMNYIPIVSMRNSGGWSDKLIGTYLDERKKFKIAGATTALEAVTIAEELFYKFSHIRKLKKSALSKKP